MTNEEKEIAKKHGLGCPGIYQTLNIDAHIKKQRERKKDSLFSQ